MAEEDSQEEISDEDEEAEIKGRNNQYYEAGDLEKRNKFDLGRMEQWAENQGSGSEVGEDDEEQPHLAVDTKHSLLPSA